MKRLKGPDSRLRSSVVIALELLGLDEPGAGATRSNALSIVEQDLGEDEAPNASERRLFVVGNQVVRTAPIDSSRTLAFWEILDLVHLQSDLAGAGVFVRGAVSLGDTAARTDFAVGPAVSESLRLCGDLAGVPRVVIDPRVLVEIEQNPDFRAQHHSVLDELGYVQKLLRLDSDGMWFVDYLKAVESEASEAPLYTKFLEAHRAQIDGRLKKTERLDGTSRAWSWLSGYHNRVVEELFARARLNDEQRSSLRIPPRSPMTYAFPSSAVVAERWELPLYSRGAAESSELQSLPVLLLLDLAAPDTMADEEEVVAHVPEEHRSRLLRIRATQYGARGSKTGVPLDWQLCSDAIVKMVGHAREEAEQAGAEPCFYVAGWAALPLFAHLGWELSGWADVTLLNRRRDQGVWDVLRLGRRARPFSKEARFFSHVRGLETVNESPGPIAVLVSTRAPRENADAALFMALQGEAPTGVVRLGAHTWTESGPRRGELDEHNVTRAAYEIEKALGSLPSVFPNHRGLSLFVDGPASLAFLVGRALTPNVLRYPASIPGFNGMEGGGYYSAVTLPFRPGRRPKDGERTTSIVVLSVATDGGFLGTFETSLVPQVRAGRVTVWHAQLTEPGKDVDRELLERLQHADIVVTLLSPLFLADDRLMRQVELAKISGKRLFPILVRACSLSDTPFNKLAVLPRNGRAIASASDVATAWYEVHEELLGLLPLQSRP